MGWSGLGWFFSPRDQLEANGRVVRHTLTVCDRQLLPKAGPACQFFGRFGTQNLGVCERLWASMGVRWRHFNPCVPLLHNGTGGAGILTKRKNSSPQKAQGAITLDLAMTTDVMTVWRAGGLGPPVRLREKTWPPTAFGITEFNTFHSRHTAGCHGDGRRSSTRPLALRRSRRVC
jgi:hypothetical protein